MVWIIARTRISGERREVKDQGTLLPRDALLLAAKLLVTAHVLALERALQSPADLSWHQQPSSLTLRRVKRRQELDVR